MSFLDILGVDDIHLGVDVGSRRDAIAFLAGKSAQRLALGETEPGEERAPMDQSVLAEALGAREKLGSTGLGKGVALPHAIVRNLDRPIVQFVRLARPIDFAAPDDEPVDMLLMLLVPEQAGGEKLKSLSACAKALRQDAAIASLRTAPDAKAVLAILQAPPKPA